MPERPLWTGTVSFGLVAIPVAIVSAVRASRIPFHLLHQADNSLLQRRMKCPADQSYVHREHMIKGYEVQQGIYVEVTPDEIAALEPRRSDTIEIQHFVDLKEIDALFYDRPYYLVPDKGAEKAYSLLERALRESAKAGIAEFVMHSRKYLLALRSIDGVLAIVTLHYAEDIVSADDLAPALQDADEKVAAIEKAINSLAATFDPSQFHDEYSEQVMTLIRDKQRNGQSVQVEQVQDDDELPEAADLIAALEASLQHARDRES